MSGNIIWKFVLTVAIAAWAVLNITPLQDRPFEEYILAQASENVSTFESIVERAKARAATDEDVPSLFVALRTMGKEENIDYQQFFPGVDVRDVGNVNKRNDILLKYLLGTAQSNLRLGLDLKGGVGLTYVLERPADAADAADRAERESKLSQAIGILSDRLDSFGVAEPVVRAKGDNAIEVQVAGLTTKDDPEIFDTIAKPARLEFRQVYTQRNPATGQFEPVSPLSMDPENYPVGYEVLVLERENHREGSVDEIPYFVKRLPEAKGDIVLNARASQDQTGGYVIGLEMKAGDKGANIFADITERMVGQPLAIVLDGKLYSAPTIQGVLSKRCQINGDFTAREAIELANVLNNPLDVPLRVDQKYEVDGTLAADARAASVNAAITGGVLVVGFMLAYYFLGGVIAVLSSLLNVIIVLGVLASLGATLTLPGIAALVLTLGMGVDANILIFERIREELRSGKSIRHATSSGFEKVLSTIVDANVTTLITAAILIYFGTGPVKGFGVTLAIGICSSIFCALIVTRFVTDFLVHKLGVSKVLGLVALPEFKKLDFFKYRKPAFVAAWLLVSAGLVATYLHRDNILGIDFTGGDEMTVTFEERLSTGEIRSATQEMGEVNPVYQRLIGDGREVLKLQTEFDQSREVLAMLQAAFPDAGLEEDGMTQIGATVSSDIQFNALISVLLALGGILLYVALRFEVGYGVGAVAATIHDVLMTIGLFVILGGQFTAPMLAAILMIVGYSINDTIVVFDRVREELQLNPGSNLRHIINTAISRVFSRSILTSVTTLLAAVSLYIFGAGVINDFALVFIIGIVTGTFSSIFIASPIFYWWHKGDRRHVEERELTPKRYEWESSKGETTTA